MNYSKVFEMINTLSMKEKEAFVREIMSMMETPTNSEGNSSEKSHCDILVAEAEPHRPDCPHCGAKAALGYINKKGKHKGAQRYQCKACGRKFVSTTNTAFAYLAGYSCPPLYTLVLFSHILPKPCRLS